MMTELAPHGGCDRPGCRICFPYGVTARGTTRVELPSPAAFGANGEIYETGDRVYYVAVKYGADTITFSDTTLHVDKNDPGLVTRIIDEESVMVLWLNNHEVSDHHVSVITPAKEH